MTVMQELLEEDKAYWMVLYTDGTTLSESIGHVYSEIDRTRIQEFYIMRGAAAMFTVYLPAGQDWKCFLFRRRTSLNSGTGRSVLFVFGWLTGPAWALSLEQAAYGYYPDGFIVDDPVAYPPEPYSYESLN